MNEINDLDDFEPSRIDGRGGIVKLIPFFAFLVSCFWVAATLDYHVASKKRVGILRDFRLFFSK